MALRRFLGLLRACVRGRRAMAARGARACADARVRAIGPQVEESFTAAVACAEASRALLLPARLQAEAAAVVAGRHLRRGRDQAVRIFTRLAYRESPAQALAFVLRAQEQAGAAVTVAGCRMRQAYDRVLSTYLWIAYGESAPKTPSPVELLQMFLDVVERCQDLDTLLTVAGILRELFDFYSPVSSGLIIAIIFSSIALYYKTVVPTAPEAVCPFLGLRSLEFDECPVEEGLTALFSLTATCGAMIALYVGGLCICICTDIAAFALCLAGKGSLVDDASSHHPVWGSIISWSFFDGQSVVVNKLEWAGSYVEEEKNDV